MNAAQPDKQPMLVPIGRLKGAPVGRLFAEEDLPRYVFWLLSLPRVGDRHPAFRRELLRLLRRQLNQLAADEERRRRLDAQPRRRLRVVSAAELIRAPDDTSDLV